MMFVSIYEVVGAIITIIVAIITYFKSRNRKSDVLLVSILGGILTIMVGLRFDAIPTIRNVHSLSVNLHADSEVMELAELLLKANSVARGSNEPLVGTLLAHRFRVLRPYLEAFSNERFEITERDLPAFTMDLIENAEESFRATSYVRLDEWWNQPWGNSYELANIDAVKRGVEVSRTFIFSGSDTVDNSIMENAVDHMKTQLQNGIKIYFVDANRLRNELTSDIVLIDNRLAGELVMTPARSFSAATFFTEDDEVERIRKALDEIQIIHATEFAVDDEGNTNELFRMIEADQNDVG